jgi:hypothetical protein
MKRERRDKHEFQNVFQGAGLNLSRGPVLLHSAPRKKKRRA